MLINSVAVLLISAQAVASYTLPANVLYAPIASDFYDCRAVSKLPDKKNPVLWSLTTDIIDDMIRKQPESVLNPGVVNRFITTDLIKDTNGVDRKMTLDWELAPTSTGQYSQVIQLLCSDVRPRLPQDRIMLANLTYSGVIKFAISVIKRNTV